MGWRGSEMAFEEAGLWPLTNCWLLYKCIEYYRLVALIIHYHKAQIPRPAPYWSQKCNFWLVCTNSRILLVLTKIDHKWRFTCYLACYDESNDSVGCIALLELWSSLCQHFQSFSVDRYFVLASCCSKLEVVSVHTRLSDVCNRYTWTQMSNGTLKVCKFWSKY